MKQFMRNRLSYVWLIAVLVAACSTAQIKAVWKDPAYLEHPGKVMVLSVTKSPVSRRVFEDEFVLQLKAHGTDAIASYTVLPDSKDGDQALIAQKVKEQGADTVLITRLVSTKTVKVVVPGTVYYPPRPYGKWRDYYSQGYQAMYTPSYVTKDKYALMESNLYDARNDNLIWAATTQTEMNGADHKLVKSYIGLMVQAMVEQGLLNR
jgi:hypothetical protein